MTARVLCFSNMFKAGAGLESYLGGGIKKKVPDKKELLNNIQHIHCFIKITLHHILNLLLDKYLKQT